MALDKAVKLTEMSSDQKNSIAGPMMTHAIHAAIANEEVLTPRAKAGGRSRVPVLATCIGTPVRSTRFPYVFSDIVCAPDRTFHGGQLAVFSVANSVANYNIAIDAKSL